MKRLSLSSGAMKRLSLSSGVIVACLVVAARAAPSDLPTSSLAKRSPVFGSGVFKFFGGKGSASTEAAGSSSTAGASSSSNALAAVESRKYKRGQRLYRDADGLFFQPGRQLGDKPYVQPGERERIRPTLVRQDDGSHLFIAETGHAHSLRQVDYTGRFDPAKKPHHRVATQSLSPVRPPPPPSGQVNEHSWLYRDVNGGLWTPSGQALRVTFPLRPDPRAKPVLLKSDGGHVHVWPNGQAHELRRVDQPLPDGLHFDPAKAHHIDTGRNLGRSAGRR